MPAGNTYVAIAEQTLGSAAATVTFSSIPGTYTDLVLVGSMIGNAGNDCHIRVNGDSGTNYSNTLLFATGGTITSSRTTNSTLIYGNVTSTDTGEVNTMLVSFNNYSNTTINKTVLVRYNSATSGKYVTASVALWRNTSAINSITVTTAGSGNFGIGTSISLYGIKAA
jgi:hypothetical protein